MNRRAGPPRLAANQCILRRDLEKPSRKCSLPVGMFLEPQKALASRHVCFPRRRNHKEQFLNHLRKIRESKQGEELKKVIMSCQYTCTIVCVVISAYRNCSCSRGGLMMIPSCSLQISCSTFSSPIATFR